MAVQREYDGGMSRLNRATVAGFGLILVGLLSTGVGLAQIHGAPPSVTSMGFGGHAVSGISPSVTSLGPRGFAFNPALPSSRPWFGIPRNQPFGNRPHHHPRASGIYYGVPYYGYYGNGYYDNDTEAESYAPEQENNVGPTIFERRGGYVAPPAPERQAEVSAAAPPPEDAAEPDANGAGFQRRSPARGGKLCDCRSHALRPDRRAPTQGCIERPRFDCDCEAERRPRNRLSPASRDRSQLELCLRLSSSRCWRQFCRRCQRRRCEGGQGWQFQGQG